MDKLEIIKKPIEKELGQFRQLFDESLVSKVPLLNQVLAYIKKRNGKMMRPILVMLMARLFGEANGAAYHGALSLELLHTASLVHDDVVDESDRRRGQLSVNALFDNKVSVLVGDFLLATSLKHAALTSHVELVALVARLGQHLAEGELIQLANTANEDFSEEVYFDVIRKKTAALFIASAEMGARAVGATPEEACLAALFGELAGIAFQIKDDIFDYSPNPDLGKPTGNDMLEGKLTLPALHVLNKVGDERMKALAIRIRQQEATSEEIAGFVQAIKEQGGIEYAEKVMYEYRNKAVALLQETMNTELREALVAYIDYVIERKR